MLNFVAHSLQWLMYQYCYFVNISSGTEV